MGDRVLGKKINYVRKQKKMTSEKLAELCDVNAGHIRQIEAGTRLPSFRLFVEICNSLMVSPNYLLEQDLIASEDYEEKYKSIFQKVKKLTPDQIETLDYLLDAVIKKNGI